MPSTFDDLMEELQEAGFDESYITRIREASDASPLRKEKKDAEDRAAKAQQVAERFKSKALNATLKELGIKAKPAAIAFPDDLDLTDDEQVRTWAVDMGLAEPPPPDTDDETLDTHDRISSASQATTATNTKKLRASDMQDWDQAKLLDFKSKNPEAWKALLRDEEVPIT